NTLQTTDLGRLIQLEGCIAGNVPLGAKPYGKPHQACAQFAREKPAEVVFGPGTFLLEAQNRLLEEFDRRRKEAAAQGDRAAEAARRIARSRGYSRERARELAEGARRLVDARFQRDLLQLALRSGLRALPSIMDPNFVGQIVYDGTKPGNVPKARFAYLFPTRNAALIQVRLKPDLSEQERHRAIALVREAIGMEEFRTKYGGTYTVTGAPVVLDDLAEEVSDAIPPLIFLALVVMAVALLLVFAVRPALRLLPLAVAVVASALTFGALALVGASLTMASIAVLPILIGLAVDYAIQLQSRTAEAQAGDDEASVARGAARMAVAGAPAVTTAAAATIAGFLVLVLSPVPMVRGFGLLLVAGIAVALLVALTAGTAALVLAGRARGRATALAAMAAEARAIVAPAVRGAAELTAPVRDAASRAGTAALRGVIGLGRRRARWVLAGAAVLALAGWVLDTQTKVESDVTKLVPQDLRALRDLDALQRETGVGGQLDVLVEGRDLARPEVVEWMTSYQKRLLDRYRFSKDNGCGRAELCPAFSLPDLFRGERRTAEQIESLLEAVPPYFSKAVITEDRRTATLSFGIRLMPLERQKEVIDVMREELDPPEGVRARLAGLPVLAAEANAAVSSDSRRLLTLLAGLLAVFAVLLVALRHWRRAAVPLVPIVLATGWSSLVLFALRIPLNPMSVTLGALVIAISTEFSVLLAERYRQEREAGHAPAEALALTYRSTGRAVLASGVTAIAGFAVLVASDIRMLRDFGFVTVVDLSVSLLGVLIVLPSVLLLAEGAGSLRWARLRR
ncbi:MAG TPA: MMPL family transporter, partial [Solirubrobacteraceae bacterium]|nr:MMPL family transporter [Solirubrobacteraceae bacterium]